MSSLRDALRQAGLSESKKGEQRSKSRRGRGQGKKSGAPDGHKHVPSQTAELDLAAAYRARRVAEKQQVEQKKRAKQAAQEARRQRNQAMEKILKDQSLNVAEAEMARFFEHGGRVRRVLCTLEQRAAVNEGELAVVMFRGRALLVAPAIAQQIAQLAPDAVPNLTADEPSAGDGGDDDGYPPVPDDLIW